MRFLKCATLLEIRSLSASVINMKKLKEIMGLQAIVPFLNWTMQLSLRFFPLGPLTPITSRTTEVAVSLISVHVRSHVSIPWKVLLLCPARRAPASGPSQSCPRHPPLPTPLQRPRLAQAIERKACRLSLCASCPSPAHHPVALRARLPAAAGSAAGSTSTITTTAAPPQWQQSVRWCLLAAVGAVVKNLS